MKTTQPRINSNHLETIKNYRRTALAQKNPHYWYLAVTPFGSGSVLKRQGVHQMHMDDTGEARLGVQGSSLRSKHTLNSFRAILRVLSRDPMEWALSHQIHTSPLLTRQSVVPCHLHQQPHLGNGTHQAPTWPTPSDVSPRARETKCTEMYAPPPPFRLSPRS